MIRQKYQKYNFGDGKIENYCNDMYQYFSKYKDRYDDCFSIKDKYIDKITYEAGENKQINQYEQANLAHEKVNVNDSQLNPQANNELEMKENDTQQIKNQNELIVDENSQQSYDNSISSDSD